MSPITEDNPTVMGDNILMYTTAQCAVVCKNPFQIDYVDGIFAFQPKFYYGQRSGVRRPIAQCFLPKRA